MSPIMTNLIEAERNSMARSQEVLNGLIVFSGPENDAGTNEVRRAWVG